MKGFTIKCNECGKETIYINGKSFMETDNSNVTITPNGYGGEVAIICDCGQKIQDN